MSSDVSRAPLQGELSRPPAHEAFLRELTALSNKHRMYISGCGCCGSPQVSPFSEDEKPITRYTVNENGDLLQAHDD